jgi:hypothetical protein
MQECLTAYKKLIEWLPAYDDVEKEMKSERINVIRHLVQLCGSELEKLSEAYRSEGD